MAEEAGAVRLIVLDPDNIQVEQVLDSYTGEINQGEDDARIREAFPEMDAAGNPLHGVILPDFKLALYINPDADADTLARTNSTLMVSVTKWRYRYNAPKASQLSNPVHKRLLAADLLYADADQDALSNDRFQKIGEYTVPRGLAISPGFGLDKGQVDTIGRIYMDIQDDT